MTLLQGINLSKYFGGLAAVKNVDFEVKKGEILALIGPNGAGKTTLFNLITGVYKPDKGRVIFKGEDITGLQPHKICKKGIARTFQIVRSFTNMSVLENVMVGALYGRESKSVREARQIAINLLEYTGLLSKKDTLVKNLTVIDKKLTELTKALATKPELLMIDELMAGLNPVETSDLMIFLRKIKDNGVTILWVEHVMKAVMGISDRVIVMHHGEKIAEGTPSEVAKDVRVVKAYFGG